MEPSKIKKESDTAIGIMCIDVFGEDWEEYEIAHMSTFDGIGIEMFSFPNGVKKDQILTRSIQDFSTFVFKTQILKN